MVKLSLAGNLISDHECGGARACRQMSPRRTRSSMSDTPPLMMQIMNNHEPRIVDVAISRPRRLCKIDAAARGVSVQDYTMLMMLASMLVMMCVGIR